MYLKGTCSDVSFYQCLGAIITTEKDCQIDGLSCAPTSLPLSQDPIKEYPICKVANVTEQCQNRIDSKEERCRTLKPCSVQEYAMGEYKLYSGNDIDYLVKIMNQLLQMNVTKATLQGQQDRKYMFVIYLSHPPSTRGSYRSQFQKDVQTERLVWSEIAIVGNIGGYMGLCVGFSFTGFLAWLLGLFPKVWFALGKIKEQVKTVTSEP